MFVDKFHALCQSRHTKIRTVCKELGIGSSTVTNWINGIVPKLNHALKVAEYFNVSLDYLIGDADVSVKPNEELKNVQSISDRVATLQAGNYVPKNAIVRISEYTNSSMLFLLAETDRFIPEPIDPIDNLTRIFDFSALDIILDVMDKCAANETFRILQVQLSRIVLYQLSKVGVISPMLADLGKISAGKINYITYGASDTTNDNDRYGFTFSELTVILARYEEVPSFQFMFTGIEDDPVQLLKTNSELRKKIIGE